MKRVLRLFALVLALMMMVSLFSACGETETVTQYVDENGNPIDYDPNAGNGGGGEPNTDNSDEGDSTDTSSQGGLSATTSGGGSGNGNGGGSTEVVKGKTKFEKDPYSDIPASLKGTTVRVLLWRTPEATDTALAEAFTKKTGIKVEYVYTANNNSAYATKLATMISSKDSPDLVSMGSGTFPSFAITSLEPLDEEVFRLDDPFWNKTLVDGYKINGKAYALASYGSWYSDDVNFVTYYNPAALKANGIETMPYQIWKANKSAWSINKMVEIARKFKSKDDTYFGISYQSNTCPNPYMLSSGVDFVKYNGKEYTNNMNDATVLKTNMDLADWFQEGLVTGWNSAGVGAGTVGLFDAIAYGMYVDANWFTIPTSQIECVPVAGTHTPCNPKMWCVPKGAKNAQGAAYFLRFFLDSESFKETSFGSFKKTFATEQMYEVFMYMAADSTPKAINYSRGVLDHYDTSSYNQLCNKLSSTTSANIKTELDSFSSTMKAACNRANKNLKKVQTKPSYVG